MEEESSGNYLYIIFIFIGVALLSVGIFFYFTDDHVELEGHKEENKENNNNNKEEVKEVPLKFSIVNLDEEKTATIKLNNKDINIAIKENEENIELLFNDKALVTEKSTGSIDLYQTDEYLFAVSSSGSRMSNNLYVIDSEGNKLKNYHLDSGDDGLVLYQEYVDGKLNIYGTRIDENNLVYASSELEGIDVCDLDLLKEKNVSNTITVFAKYDLKYYSNKEFKMTQQEDSKQTLVEYQQKYCTGEDNKEDTDENVNEEQDNDKTENDNDNKEQNNTKVEENNTNEEQNQEEITE